MKQVVVCRNATHISIPANNVYCFYENPVGDELLLYIVSSVDYCYAVSSFQSLSVVISTAAILKFIKNKLKRRTKSKSFS